MKFMMPPVKMAQAVTETIIARAFCVPCSLMMSIKLVTHGIKSIVTTIATTNCAWFIAPASTIFFKIATPASPLIKPMISDSAN